MENRRSFKSWQVMTEEEVLSFWHTNPNGLSAEEAGQRLVKFGPNKIPERDPVRFWIIAGNQFKNPLIYILLLAGLIAFLLKDVLNAFIILVAVVMNAAVGFAQEWKASHLMKQLRSLISYKAFVRREGKMAVVDSSMLAPGDIIVLRPGDLVPADARLIKSAGLKTNEVILTGESQPVRKNTNKLTVSIPMADRSNMIWLGTSVEDGVGEAVVVATGQNTELGKITSLIRKESKFDETPLQYRLKSLARALAMIFLAVSTLLFVVGVFSGQNIFSMFLTAVAVAVAAVPEGLPIALTITLAVGARKILTKRGLVRKILAAETLGSTTVIAADKTATLTEGKMYVTKLINGDGNSLGKESFLTAVEEKNDSFGYLSLRLMTLLSGAGIENPEESKEKWRLHGSPVDKAILLTSQESGLNRETLQEENPKLAELPFSSFFKYSAVLSGNTGGKNTISVLGAPEVVLEMCSYFYAEGEEIKHLGREQQALLHKNLQEAASSGFRVLALAFKKQPASSPASLDRSILNHMVFLSLVMIADPIRKDVKEAISKAKSAGIKVIMISGDHLLTAKFVARELGIMTDEERAVTSADLPPNLKEVVKNYDVFARVSPEDKVKITDALKRNGEIVAMIGDGVNDAPSLLRADLGVALGSGTDVAKEASDLILLDDSFSIIVEAIKRGRIIFDNIRKTIIFLLSGAFTEIILISGSIFTGLPLAILPGQILWVNLIEDGLPSVSLAFEEEEDGVMRRRPRGTKSVLDRETKILIGLFAIITDLVLFGLFYLLFRSTGDIGYARTMTFVGLGLTSLFYIFSVRSLHKPVWKNNVFSNKILNFSVALGLILYLTAIYFAPLREVLKTTVLGIGDWFILILLGLFNIFVIEVGKSFLIKSHCERAGARARQPFDLSQAKPTA